MSVDPRTLTVDPHDTLARLRAINPNLPDRVKRDAADLIAVVVPLWDVWLTARPPCPTCDGRGKVSHCWECEARDIFTEPCPDCPESPGIQPFDKWTAGLVALWTVSRGAICDDLDCICATCTTSGCPCADANQQIGGAR